MSRRVMVACLVVAMGCGDKDSSPASKKAVRVHRDAGRDPEIAVLITPDAYLLATAGGDLVRVASCGTALDHAALTEELCKLRLTARYRTAEALEVAGAEGVDYQMIVRALDAADHAGLDAWLAHPQELKVPIRPDRKTARSALAACGQFPRRCAPASPASTAKLPPEPILAQVAVVTITRDQILLNKAPIADIRDLSRSSGKLLEPLRRALDRHRVESRALKVSKAAQHSLATTLVIQADKRTSASLLTRVAATADERGYSNLLYAINRGGSRPSAP